MSAEFLAIVSFLALVFSIWVLILIISYLISVPRSLEHISATLRMMYEQQKNSSIPNNPVVKNHENENS